MKMIKLIGKINKKADAILELLSIFIIHSLMEEEEVE